MSEAETLSTNTEADRKKVLAIVAIPMILLYFLVYAIFIKNGSTKGITLFQKEPVAEIKVSEDVANPQTFSHVIQLPVEGYYKIKTNWDVTDPGFITGFVGKTADGTKLFAITAAQITGYSNQLELASDSLTLEYYFLTNEADYRRFAGDYQVFSTDAELEQMISKIDFASMPSNGSWDFSYGLEVYEVKPVNGTVILICLAIGLIATILVFLIWKGDSAEPADFKEALGKIGVRYAFFLLLVCLVQISASLVIQRYFPELVNWLGPNLNFFMVVIPIDLIAFPVTYFICQNVPTQKIPQRKLGIPKFLLYVLIGAGGSGVGVVIGAILNTMLALPFGNTTADISPLMQNGNYFLRIITLAIMTPIFEELLYRKLLIDRLIKYGEFTAILASGLMFGLFHGNFSQVFFATFLGLLWAYVYVRTGKILYTIALHITVNLSTSVITNFLAGKYMEFVMPYAMSGDTEGMIQLFSTSPEALVYAILYLSWLGFLALLCVAGVIVGAILFFMGKFRLEKTEDEPSRATIIRSFFTSRYMWMFIIGCIGLFIFNYVPSIVATLMR